MDNIYSPQFGTKSENGFKENLKELVRFAIAAPSSHNSQPWKFLVRKDSITVEADWDRWLPIADPTKRELWISVGCALENLLIAARFAGLEYMWHLNRNPSDREVVKIFFQPHYTRTKADELLFENILERQTCHKRFNGHAIPETILKELNDLNDFEELQIVVWKEENLKDRIAELVKEADLALMSNPEFRKELGEWIGKGVFGTPKLVSKIGQVAVSKIDIGKGLAKRDADMLKKSPAIVFINAENDRKETQVKVGMLYERIGLFLNNYNIRTQPISSILEHEETREKLKKQMPDENTLTQLFFRMGYADKGNKKSVRRDLEEVVF